MYYSDLMFIFDVILLVGVIVFIVNVVKLVFRVIRKIVRIFVPKQHSCGGALWNSMTTDSYDDWDDLDDWNDWAIFSVGNPWFDYEQDRLLNESLRQQSEWAMSETMKACTPFEHGGYDMNQGNSFNNFNNGMF